MSALYRGLKCNSHFLSRYTIERKVKKLLRTAIRSVHLHELESFQIIQILFKEFDYGVGVNWTCLSLFSNPLAWYFLTWNAFSYAILDSAEAAVLPATVLSRLITHMSQKTLEDLLQRLLQLVIHLKSVSNSMSSVSRKRSTFFIFVIVLEAISLKQYAKIEFSSRDSKICQKMLLLLSELEWGFRSLSSSWSTLDFIFAVAMTRGKQMVVPHAKSLSQTLHCWTVEGKEFDIEKFSEIPFLYTLLLVKQLQKLRIHKLLSGQIPDTTFVKSTMEDLEKISNSCSFLFYALKQNSREAVSNDFVLELCLHDFLFANTISSESNEPTSANDQEMFMIPLDCLFNFTLLPVPEHELQDIISSKFQLYKQSTNRNSFLKHLFCMISQKIVSNLENSLVLLKASIGILPFLTESEGHEFLQQFEVLIQNLPREYQDSTILLVAKQLSTLSYSHASSFLPHWASLLISPAR
ncbi:uncharacterized protein SOCG_03083 [Schizosaccharomyces octosporus yFS286]|uniref:Uncharacterized protein n=1 Tax=Schizosaccharomyces octosporus (strain yFS286) TaxID=483514 RepID=S9RIN3_SCHOY|nr:uncharacterized protein SOCG_03083 [Schizosaccharomyces octosporus yFS286]EPX73864.1 hypothetical protein SOCG_03083 [Schizosaccharomyces octosporus yFS286]